MNRIAFVLSAVAIAALPSISSADESSGVLHGPIFTTDSLCDGEKVHRFDPGSSVRLDSRAVVDPDEADEAGGAALPDGVYFVAVTDPNGNVLGSSVTASDRTPLHIAGGSATSCVDLSIALRKTSDGTAGFDATLSRGGVYKVFVSTLDTFEKKSTVSRTFQIRLRKPSESQAAY